MPNNPSAEVDKPVSAKTADEINDLFNTLDTEDDAKPSDKEIKPIESEEPKDKEPDEEDDLELKEPDEEVEKLDLKTDEDIEVDAPPRKKEILAKYPNVFKDFPFLEKIMYRDRQYTELFGSFDDAKEIAEKSDTFNQFESQLLEGNTEEILRNVKEVDETAFKTIVDDYLTTLHKVDKDAYLHVTGNLNRRLIIEMVQEANETSNDELKQAALLVNQFVFGTAKFTAPTRLVDKAAKGDEKANAAEEERRAFAKERFETSRDELQSQVDNTLRATISEYIDPRGNMSAYVKKNAVNDAMKILNAAIVRDPTVVKNLDKLWRGAFDAKFSRDSLGKIKSYFLSKAKANLKNAIIKARAEALKDAAPSRSREKDEEETPSRSERRNIAPGRPSQPKSGKNEMKKGESVTDFFMRD